MPKILYLTPFWPGHSGTASELRSKEVARALQDFGEVKIVVVHEECGSGEVSAQGTFDVVHCVPVRPFPNTGPLQKINWALNPRSSRPHGMAADQRDLHRAFDAAGHFDLVWIFKLRTANVFPHWAWKRSVVDVDDVPSTFERSVLSQQCRLPEQLGTAIRLWSWRRREKLLGERFSVLAVCSEADRTYLNGLGVKTPIRVVPNGYNKPACAPLRRLATPPRIGFIGLFDHRPNMAGIQWFARHCWPLVKHAVPDARLRLVGRYSEGALMPQGSDIDALGWLTDPTDEMATWTSMVVPVQLGAGTRGKIAHAFSQKCPVVSTSLGAYGYDPRDGHNMFLAESAESFAAACIRTVQQPVEAAAMAERAWQQFLDRWTWDAIRPSVWAAAEDCLQSK